MQDNRRALNRWSIKRPAKVRIEDHLNFEDCYIDDLNFKGLRMSLSERLPLDSSVRMTLSFTDSLDFEVEAAIPWTRESEGRYIYGLLFTRIKDVDKERIYKYIYSNCFEQLKNQWWQ